MNERSAQLDQITQAFITAFGSLTPKELNWKPNADTWSIAQNLDHIMVVNESYYPTFEALKAHQFKAPWLSRIGFFVSWIGKLVLDATQPDRRKKMKTFPLWEPHSSQMSADILEKFEQHQQTLGQKMEELKAWAEKGTVISSPANKNVVYKLDTAFDIIIAHEYRHLEQAKEVLTHMKKLHL